MRDFDIIALAISTEETVKNKDVNSFLLQQKEDPEKCVAIIGKKQIM